MARKSRKTTKKSNNVSVLDYLLKNIIPEYISECPFDEDDKTITLSDLEDYLLSYDDVMNWVLTLQTVDNSGEYGLLFEKLDYDDIVSLCKTIKKRYEIIVSSIDFEDDEDLSNDDLNDELDDTEESERGLKVQNITELFCKDIKDKSEVMDEHEERINFIELEQGIQLAFWGISATPVLLDNMLSFIIKNPNKNIKKCIKGLDDSAFSNEELLKINDLSKKTAHQNIDDMIENSIDEQEEFDYHNYIENDHSLLSINEDVDNKRQKLNKQKQELVYKREFDIITNIKKLHDFRKTILNSKSINEDDLDNINVKIAQECSKIHLHYQYMCDLTDKAQEFYELYQSIYQDTQKILKISNLPTEWVNEYFENKNNYLNHKFWKNKEINNDGAISALKAIDNRCIEFEKLVGRSPMQFNNLYKKQMIVGVKRASKAREEIIYRNTRLVISLAQKIKDTRNTSISASDLYMEGMIGLIMGVENFEYQRGNKVSTYVTWNIRQRINRLIDDSRHIIKMTQQKALINDISSIFRQYENRYFKKPSENYVVMKYLLKIYLKQKNGNLSGLLPEEFLQNNVEKTYDFANQYLNGIHGVPVEYIERFNLLRQEWQSKQSNSMGRKADKSKFKPQKPVEVKLLLNHLLLNYLLEKFEEQYGIDYFQNHPFFQKHLDDSDNKRGVVSKIKNAFITSQSTVSLENEVGDGEETNTYRDTIKAEQDSIEDEIIKKEYQIKLIDILNKYLKPKEVQILAFRYGIDMQAEQDLGVISQNFNVSKERIRQIINTAIKKLATVDELRELFEKLNQE